MTYEYTYVSRMRKQTLDPDTIYPKAFARITEQKNQLKVRFTDPDQKEAKHTVAAVKTETLGELTEKIAKVCYHFI